MTASAQCPPLDGLDLISLRRLCTRETYQQARRGVIDMLDSASVIPAAHSPEQAWVETLVLHNLKADLGLVSAHPLGIRAVSPRRRQLVVELDPEPAVIRHWARSLLPVARPGEELSGVRGLRWQIQGQHIRLNSARGDCEIRLQGFPTHWWTEIVTVLVRDCETEGGVWCSARPTYSAEEGDGDLSGCRREQDPYLGSGILRRIGVTQFPTEYGGTDLWSFPNGPIGWIWKLETIAEIDHNRAAALLTHPQVGIPGLRIAERWCHCGLTPRSGCEVVIRGRRDQQLLLRDLRWTVTPERLKQRARSLDEDNDRAFRSDPLS